MTITHIHTPMRQIAIKLRRIKNALLRRKPASFDNLKTFNNLYFLNEEKFLAVYNQSRAALNFRPHIPLRVHQAIWAAMTTASVDGNIVELGTGKGFVFQNVMNYAGDRLQHKKIFLCDTFLPFKTDITNGSQTESQGRSDIYSTSDAEVAQSFKDWSNVRIIKGKLPTSLEQLKGEIGSIAFLHVDLNYYLAEIQSLELLWEQISKGAIILLDDFGNPGRETQMHEHLKFFASKDQAVLALASGQGLIVKM